MNSSGIKRGLATTAVSALAIAGLPLFASSASAATGDSIAVASVGPVRNDGALGGVIVLKTKGIDETKLRVAATDLVSKANTPNQTIDILSASKVLNGANGDSNKTDGLDEITLNVKISTSAAGDAFSFAVYEDEDGTRPAIVVDDPGTVGVDENADSIAAANAWDNGAQTPDVDATESRATVSGTTAGAPASVAISPDSQTTSAGVPTGDYTATVRDASNNLTQLTTGEAFALAGTGVTFTPDATLSATDMVTGQSKFKASSNTAGETTFTATGNGVGATVATITDSAVINVIANATITADEFDLVTGADTFKAGDAFGGTYEVRVDQNQVTFKFASLDKDLVAGPDDANKAIVLTLSSGSLTFDGSDSPKTYTVVLGNDGTGSLTVNLGNVTAGSSFTFGSASSGINPTTVQLNRAAADSVEANQDVYVTKVGQPTAVTVTVLDQFGNPIGSPAQVQLIRSGNGGRTANDGTTARVTVGADGTATFNLPDAGTTVGSEDFDINLFQDQFDGTGNAGNPFTGGTIYYTADGLGENYSLNDVSTGTIVPLTDAKATDAVTEYKTLTITGGTPGAPATVSVDNGALIVGTDNTLAKATASKTITLSGLGAGSVQIIGTKTGTVNVTVVSGGRTKTESLTVKQATGNDLLATARNVELDGPESVVAGDVATYTATVTDAFGNPIAGLDDSNVAFQVSGPAALQNKEAATDANGEIEQTVLLTDNADGSITVRVAGVNDGGLTPVVTQFGKAANSVSVANDAPGLSASMDSDSITADVVNLEALQAAVAKAQADLAAAQADLAEAQGNLDIANTELAVAQANVDTLTAKKAELRQKLNKAKANDNRRKAKTLRQKLRAVKRNLNAAQDDLTIAAAKAAVAQGVVDRRQAAVDAAEEALAQAQQNLDDAQN